MKFWSAHTHSKFSAKDALPTVQAIVDRAAELQYPALGLTDHGNPAGSVQLYQACRKAGIEPLPGIEAYVSMDRLKGKRPLTSHMGMLATTEQGYRNLVGLSNMAHSNFRYGPVLDMSDLATAAADGRLEGVACMTGCWFGVIPKLLREGNVRAVQNVIMALDRWFGAGCYIEIQNHQIEDETHNDDLQAGFLWTLADVMGMPTVITQDSHYVNATDRPVHETMKRLVSWSDDPDDAVFPGDGYHMVDDDWMMDHHSAKIYASGMEGLSDLLGKAKVVIPELDTFRMQVPDITVSGDPDKELIDMAMKVLHARIADGTIKKVHVKQTVARAEEEIDVVVGAGFPGYLLFTKMVCDKMRSEGIVYNVRGSASGSLLCWLLDITQFNPIEWGLDFSRFLSRDRTKPPDIDLDVEHLRREEVLEWLKNDYITYRIGTWAKMGIGIDGDGDQAGSILVRWKTKARRTGRDPNAPIPDDEWLELTDLASFKAYNGYGVHAGGVLIAPDEQSISGVPLQWVASSETMITGLDMNDVEAMGLLKLDLLGLRTLSALKTMETITGITKEEVPLNDRKVYQAMGRGETAGVFQLEGGSAKNGIRRLKPTGIKDVIAAMALFRPACQDTGTDDAYIDRRHGLAHAVRHEILARHTQKTYGLLIFQEQVIWVLRDLGMGPDDLTKFLKAVKASNQNIGDAGKVIDSYKDKVYELARAADMAEVDINWLWTSATGFAAYGFNLAHSTSYGVLAYITCWYKVHAPVAYWTGMLNAYIGTDKEKFYLSEVLKAKITVRNPNVNRSGVHYTADVPGKAIRRGLQSIKGVGGVAATELAAHAPYSSIADLAERVGKRAVPGCRNVLKNHHPSVCGGVIGVLWEAGALDGVPLGYDVKETNV